MAEELYRAGALWNTFVFASRATALVEAGSDCLPALHERLVRLSKFLGTEHERWAIRQAYELSPRANFSQAVLERCPRKLAVVRPTRLRHAVGQPEAAGAERAFLALEPIGGDAGIVAAHEAVRDELLLDAIDGGKHPRVIRPHELHQGHEEQARVEVLAAVVLHEAPALLAPPVVHDRRVDRVPRSPPFLEGRGES